MTHQQAVTTFASERYLLNEMSEGERTGFEIVAEIVGAENVNTPVSAWVLQIVLSCLDHLTILGEVEPVDGTDPQRWVLL